MVGARPGAARTAALTASTALLVGASLTLGPPAYASGAHSSTARAAKGSSGYCTGGSGVTVVVDFQELGGGTVVRCAPGSQSTGLSALKNAGFRIAGTNRWGESFICRIQGRPGPDSEPCIDTPPTSAYWSYWHSSNGGSWKYSQSGVTNRTPPQGSFEGWSFSKDKSQSSSPPPGVAPRRPGGDGGSGGGGNSGGGSGSSGGSGSGTSSGGSSGSGPGGQEHKDEGPDGRAPKDEKNEKDDKGRDKNKDGKKDKESAKPSESGKAAPTTDASAGTDGAKGGDGEGQNTAHPAQDGGIPTGTVASAGAVVLIAAAAGATAWRRRRSARAGEAG